MIKRTLHFGNPAYLKRKDNQIVVYYPENTSNAPDRTVPIEDVGMLILEHQQINISHALISSLLEHNCAIVFTDTKHMPSGMLLNMQGHTELSERHILQSQASLPLKKNLWQQTIQAKITNQAVLLQKMGLEYSELKNLIPKVKSGDTDNLEGRAAAYYWKRLFDAEIGFKRGRYEDAPNNLLNYGYAILRAIVARSLCGSGLWPALGIHHKSKYNSFCLADDIMEPYRPYVDQLVCQIIDEPEDYSELSADIKRKLLVIPALDVHIDSERSPLMVAMQRTTASLARCLAGESKKLIYPYLE